MNENEWRRTKEQLEKKNLNRIKRDTQSETTRTQDGIIKVNGN
jgi:hypothetical protein